MSILLAALFLHFVADFLLQSRKMGKEKSEKFSVLMQHIRIQFGVLFVGMIPVATLRHWEQGSYEVNGSHYVLTLLTAVAAASLLCSLVNAAVHAVIDWNIWRLYKLYVFKQLTATARKNNPTVDQETIDKLVGYAGANFKYWEDHWFYATIGFDQMLHTMTLVLVYVWMV